MKNLLSSSAIAAVLAIALPVWAQTRIRSAMGPATFDGSYIGSLTSTPGTGFSSGVGSNRSKCWTSAPAKMTIRGGYMVMEYPDWKRHTLRAYRVRIGMLSKVWRRALAQATARSDQLAIPREQEKSIQGSRPPAIYQRSRITGQ